MTRPWHSESRDERTRPHPALGWLFAPPALYALLAIAGPFTTDPVRLFAGISVNASPGWLPGFGTIDPNMGFTAYALGRRAAEDLLSLHLPLWNPFEGLGGPLLGEMQSAALFPPTLLLLLPHGQVWEQALLQVVAGFGTYALLRRLGLGITAALLGGVLFEVNGTFAWLRNAIYNPVAFLPWLLYVAETLAAGHLSWRERLPTIALGALAGALAIYAGFPETVYFYGLLLGLWAALRLVQARGRRLDVLASLLLAAAWALVIAAPVVLAFAQFLRGADVGGHTAGLFSSAILPPQALLPTFLPYVYGPIFAFPLEAIGAVFGRIGGYWGLMPPLLAAAGLYVERRHALPWLLAGWVMFALAVTHGVPVLHDAFMRVPLVAISGYSRYLAPSWMMCGIVLAATFLDRLPGLPAQARRVAGWTAACVVIAALLFATALAWPTLRDVWGARLGGRSFALASAGAAVAILAGFALALRQPRALRLLAALAVAEALVAFLLPLLSNPHIRGIDKPLVGFLRQHAGTQRVATVSGAAVMPNFGSAFRVATVNYDDLPTPARAVAYVAAHLDPHAGDATFRPTAGPVRGRAEIEAHLPGYRAASVRYVLAPQGFFSPDDPAAPPEAFRSLTASVYELVDAAPYAEAPDCRIVTETRDHLRAQCGAPARLVRRELFMEGWTARVNDTAVPVRPAAEAFQSVDLPAGPSIITFAYAPAGVRLSLAIAALAACAALLGLTLRRPRCVPAGGRERMDMTR